MIIIENEKEYKEKYGDSLEKQWGNISKEKQDEAIRFITPYIESDINNGVEYDADSLLRILIGYRGASLLEIILKNSAPSVRILIWEPDEAVFLAGCILENISSYIKDDRITFIFGHHDVGFFRSILEKNLFDYNMNHIAVSAVSEYRDDDNGFVSDFWKLITDMAWELNFQGNLRKRFDSLPYENYLYAIHSLNNNYTIDQLLEQIPGRDIPIIIVAAGPSLAKNCTELKEAKGKAFIIAITHAMKTLKNADVIPDAIAVTDPQKMDFMDFDEEKSYYLLSDAYASRYEQQRYDGKTVYYGFTAYEGLFTTGRISGGIDPELSTGSVSTDVFSLFIEAGFKTFILVGQDLSYDDEGHTHAGNYTEQGYCEKSGYYIMTEGINGKTVKTRFDWDRFRKSFENKINAHPEIQVIDATEGGALIHGTRIMSLKDAIKEYCVNAYNISECFANLKKGDEAERNEIKCWFEETINRCRRIESVLKELLEINKIVNAAIQGYESWDENISAACNRYDVLYHIAMEGSDGDLLRLYCKSEIQDYMEEAMTYEGDENIERRMQFEYDFFEKIRGKAEALIGYMEDLMGTGERVSE